jgi:hypothetical protein
MLSNFEKSRRKRIKEMKSFRNKMSGSNLIWFNSLSETAQYDLLFEWKKEKYFKRDIKATEVDFISKRILTGSGFNMKAIRKKVKSLTYPANIKHFFIKSRKFRKYMVSKSNLRNTAIDLLLK